MGRIVGIADLRVAGEEREQLLAHVEMLREEWRAEHEKDTMLLLDRAYARLAQLDGTLARLRNELV